MDNYNYQALVNEVVCRGINMFESFEDWTKGAFALSNLGEAGRDLFKRISMLSDKYNERENERKFTNALHTNRKTGISTFIYMCRMHGIDTNKFYDKSTVEIPQPRTTKVNIPSKDEIPLSINSSYVTKSLDKNLACDFVRYLKSLLNAVDNIVDVVNAYRLGVTREGHVIYWYIDKDDIVRMGKNMSYQANGHRDQSTSPDSIAKRLVKRGEISADYVIKKTLFGEHLLRLPENNHKTIGIVESEKTAVICSICIPNLLWMATGSIHNLQEERMSSVKDYNVILFPDTDKEGKAFGLWSRRAEELNQMGWHIQVSDYLEKTVTKEQRLLKIDIADLLVDDLESKKSKASVEIQDTS